METLKVELTDELASFLARETKKRGLISDAECLIQIIEEDRQAKEEFQLTREEYEML